MNGSLKIVAPLLAALSLAACNSGGSSTIPVSGANAQSLSSARSHHVPQWQARHLARAACPQVVGRPTCFALLARAGAAPLCSPSSNCGFTPAQLQARYGLGSFLGNGSGTIVAIVDAYDDADAASDLATYRSEFGLGTANFAKYNELGEQYGYPSNCADYGWCLEEALDIEMVSTSCPNCTIYLVESDGSISGMEEAESTAVSLGAQIVTNSWGCYHEWDCDDTNFPNAFDTTGVAYLAATGDDGYDEVGGPAALGTVLAVGGTQLRKSGSTYSETIWDDAGAGCANSNVVGSPGVAKPSWQHDPDCSNRTVGDVSAEAGCEPGVAEYASQYGGWVDVCGTSVASPLTAGIVALAGNANALNGGEKVWLLKKKQHKKGLHAITSGADGSCGNEYLCEAGLSKKHGGYETYSGPGGWGTANGIAAY